MDETYFNFPVQLLQNFMQDSKSILNDIIDYAIYEHFLFETTGNKAERLKQCAQFFGITLGNSTEVYNNGKELYEFYPRESKSPKVGINRDILFDYYKNNKTEFENISLLGFLAIKSIVQNKAYCKVTLKYWLARMDGEVRSCEFEELSEPIHKYSSRYHYGKLKEELQLNWGLKEYSNYTRGFYVSFKMSIDDLVYEVEKKRKTRKENELKLSKQKAKISAINKLNNKDTP